MAQKTFKFIKQFGLSRPKGYVVAGYLTLADEMKDKLLKQGYLVKDVVTEETITVRCLGARANVPLSERKKLQVQIDKNE